MSAQLAMFGEPAPSIAPHGDELPRARVDEAGQRWCANHPTERIGLPFYPCALCRREGAGLGAPEVEEELG